MQQAKDVRQQESITEAHILSVVVHFTATLAHFWENNIGHIPKTLEHSRDGVGCASLRADNVKSKICPMSLRGHRYPNSLVSGNQSVPPNCLSEIDKILNPLQTSVEKEEILP